MTFTLTLDTDNAAFTDAGVAHEVARILRAMATRLEQGEKDGTVRDGNGNTVGRFAIEGNE